MRLILPLLGNLIWISPAAAFTVSLGPNGKLGTGWGKDQVNFNIDTSCNDYRKDVDAAIRAAAQVWAEVPSSSLSVGIGSTITLPQPITTYVGTSPSAYAPAGNPIVYCDANFEVNSGAPADSTPGFAGATNMQSNGKIVGALLVLNVESGANANISTLDTKLLNVILTHEIGHVLGLGHSADKEALMYYATGVGREAVLAKDDIDGISFLYPRNELGGDGLMGCGTLKATGKSEGGRETGPSNSTRNSAGHRNYSWVEYALLFLFCFSAARSLRKSNSALTPNFTSSMS